MIETWCRTASLSSSILYSTLPSYKRKLCGRITLNEHFGNIYSSRILSFEFRGNFSKVSLYFHFVNVRFWMCAYVVVSLKISFRCPFSQIHLSFSNTFGYPSQYQFSYEICESLSLLSSQVLNFFTVVLRTIIDTFSFLCVHIPIQESLVPHQHLSLPFFTSANEYTNTNAFILSLSAGKISGR